MTLFGFFNPRRKYKLNGEHWERNKLRAKRRLSLERYDSSDDAQFFLYLDDLPSGRGFVGWVTERTLSKQTKYIEFKRRDANWRIKVLRADLIKALENLS
jgi:hypothetical protein